ncbi:substrate-binding periplasmic protein [Curvivirga aplysinae]|uniref:substrate-binding periplasmic protein n=1 Tax=Curvivirga aplysinae TaxID=2529852 RepID=UPI0012BC66E6|nr:transporter substrate-binding domain-containing protein [Curvivirga aplysinae]MTI11379.1 transporter substrate-binding domain-containing protein [Curvivirga aplysinae]
MLMRTLCLSLLLLLPLTSITKAADKLTGCFVIWPPYTQLIDDKPYGITVDIMHEAAKRSNYDLTLSSLPWNRCLKNVQRGDIDFAMEAVERPGFIHGKHPSALYIEAFWHRASEDYGRYKYVGLLTDKRLALMQGYKYSDEILDAGFKVIDWVQSEDSAAQLIVNDRLDLVYADVVVMQHVITKEGYELVPLLPVHNVQPLYPTFNVSLVEKRDRIDNALGQMHADGSIDQIYKKHTGLSFSDFVEISQNSSLGKITN